MEAIRRTLLKLTILMSTLSLLGLIGCGKRGTDATRQALGFHLDRHDLLQARQQLTDQLVDTVRRKIDARVLSYKEPEKAAGQAVRQIALVREGVDRDLARELVKSIKGTKLKVQVAVQGDEVRVSGKKRDDLQAVIAHVESMDIELPLQFVNFRD